MGCTSCREKTLYNIIIILTIMFVKFFLKVKHDHHERFLNALCVRCLEFSSRVKCKKCGTSGWFRGDCLQLGTLYTVRIFIFMFFLIYTLNGLERAKLNMKVKAHIMR